MWDPERVEVAQSADVSNERKWVAWNGVLVKRKHSEVLRTRRLRPMQISYPSRDSRLPEGTSATLVARYGF